MTNRLIEAKKYLGWSEAKNKASLTELLGFNPVTTSWCAGFVNAIERKCNAKGTGKLNARSFLKYGEPVDLADVQPGDIIVFKRGLPWQGHVAYYVQDADDEILVLGGNQNDEVCYKHYDKKRIIGVRRPA